jgi:hypothetical protein
MIGQKVKLIKSEVPVDLGKNGTIIEIDENGDMNVLFDEEVLVRYEDDQVHFFSKDCWLSKDQVQFL